MKESPFRVGDRVTVHTSQGGPQGLTVVEKFTHDGRCMVLADGSLWRADGKRQWSFRGSFYKGPTVEREAPGDAKEWDGKPGKFDAHFSPKPGEGD